MIKIEQPQLVLSGDFAILETFLSIDEKRDKIWFKVDKKYEPYLCFERSDAYLIAVLHYAMSNGHDIECIAPVSEDLYYNIDKYLIDAIVTYNPSFHRPQIKALVSSETLPCAGAVGTGISCGVDSLHAMATQTNLKFKNHNITHLTFNNVGSHGEGERARSLFQARKVYPQKFAEEYGFEFVLSDSNLMDVIKQSHFHTHTYSSMFPIFCLQKLYAVYYYASSGYKYHEFNLKHAQESSCGSYEMLSLPLYSSHNLRIYSEGEGLSRLMKLKEVVKYEPSYKYLNVCLQEGYNCGKCEKCIRTMLGLDILGVLDKYREVFDVEYYHTHKKWYLQQLLNQKACHKHDYFEMYPYFKKEITIGMRIKTFLYKLKTNFKNILPPSIKDHLKNTFYAAEIKLL